MFSLHCHVIQLTLASLVRHTPTGTGLYASYSRTLTHMRKEPTAQAHGMSQPHLAAVEVATATAGATTTTRTTSSTPTSWNDRDDEESLDDAEKEQRRKARAFEQQQRILQQVEAARRANTRKNQSHNTTKKLMARSTTRTTSTGTPSNSHVQAKATPSMEKGNHTQNVDQDVNKVAPTERWQCQRERPPRTKGLLYRRLPNGYLVPIEGRPWAGTTHH